MNINISKTTYDTKEIKILRINLRVIMFNIRVANKEDHVEQITNNNCAMALETENKILDESTAKFGVSRVFDNK